MIGRIKKYYNIDSRKDAKAAKEDEYNDIILYMFSLRSLRLCERTRHKALILAGFHHAKTDSNCQIKYKLLQLNDGFLTC